MMRYLIISLIFIIFSCNTQKKSISLGTHLNEKPSPPSYVNASDGTFENRIKILWEPNRSRKHYRVFRNTKNDKQSAIEIKPNANVNIRGWFISDHQVKPDRLYHYWITTVNSAGIESDYSEFDTGYIPSPRALVTPQNNFPEKYWSENNSTIEFIWTPVSKANHYRLQVIVGDSKNWSCSDGFSKDNTFLVDTIVADPQFEWIYPDNTDKISWSVQAIGETEKSFFSLGKESQKDRALGTPRD